MADIKIKRVVQNIYSFDLKNVTLQNNTEMISNGLFNEFVATFSKRDLDKGVIITPTNYIRGLVYTSANNGEFFNNPSWMPDIITFGYNLFGLKKGAFYRISVIGRNTRPYNSLMDTTNDRTLEVFGGEQDILIQEDLSNVLNNTTFVGIFRASSNEENLFFKLGKIYINNIIIDEIELLSDDNIADEILPDAEVSYENPSVKSYCVFKLTPSKDDPSRRYLELDRVTGKGLVLFYDRKNTRYILERDNVEDILNAPFTNINYTLDFNLNKLPKKGFYKDFSIVNISSDVSPNTLKQGYIEFEFEDSTDKAISYTNPDGRIAVVINQMF